MFRNYYNRLCGQDALRPGCLKDGFDLVTGITKTIIINGVVTIDH